MTLIIGRFTLEYSRGSYLFARVPRIGECFLHLDRTAAGPRFMFDRWSTVEKMLGAASRRDGSGGRGC